ncbi:MAG: rhomboid family intramembrane serine protease, partial [Gemmatimonadota bacterium]
MMPLTPWVRRLLVANVAMFFLAQPGTPLYFTLWFDPSAFFREPWTGITYQFLHAGFWHLGFNMLALYFFGPRLEERMGGGHFLAMYLGAGYMGALLSLPIGGPMVGASGAVFGVLAAYAAIWPRTVIYIWAILPIQAWALALIMV